MSALTFHAPVTTPNKMSWSDIVEKEYEEMSSSDTPTTNASSAAPSVITESTTPSLKEAAKGPAHDLNVGLCAKDHRVSQSSSTSSRRRGANTVIGNASGVSYRHCGECNAYGHVQRDCAVRAARIAKERADYAAYKARRAAREARLAATDCRRCGELGHLARDCTAAVATAPPAQNAGKGNGQRKQRGGHNNNNKGDVLVGADGKRYQLQQGGIVAPVRGRKA